MKIFLVPNASRPEAMQVAAYAVSVLRDEGAEVLLEESCRADVPGDGVRYLSGADAWESCDLAVTIGGDGTILHAARNAMAQRKPILGINTGRLGFLTIIESNELDKLRRLPRREYTIENRSVLCIENGDPNSQDLALNDVVLFKESPERTIALDIYCDEVLVSSFRGDGVVFATPTGSTAYSMSAGGPIVDARLPGIIVTQICAHIVQMPPMVFAADRTLQVISRGREYEKVFVSCDGMHSWQLAQDRPVTIHQADQTVPLVQFSDADQLKSIDKKLKGRWGSR